MFLQNDSPTSVRSRFSVQLLVVILYSLIASLIFQVEVAYQKEIDAPTATDAVNYIYWTTQASGTQPGRIWRSGATGNGATALVSGLNKPRGIELNVPDNRMYWVDMEAGLLQRASLNGSNVQTICFGLNTPEDVALDLVSNTAYWVENASGRIRKSSMDSCTAQTILTRSGAELTGIALDLVNNKVYWSEFATRSVGRANLDGTNVETLLNNMWGPLEIALDISGGRMYVADAQPSTPGYGGRIVRATLSGGGLTVIRSDLDSPRGIALDLDQGHIYWIDWGVPSLMRSNLNGSNQTVLKQKESSLDGARSLALDLSIATPCYTLTRTHTGEGGDPTANPTNSTGCPANQYIAGESITVTATAASGWRVKNWSGTNNNNSTSTTNTVTMPAKNHTVTVNYEAIPPPCYTLTRTHTGNGSKPTTSPANSTGCPTNQYTAGQTITVTATPDAGYRVAGWTGTTNDSSKATSNTVTMPASNHTVGVTYEVIPSPCYTLTRTHTGNGDDPTASPTNSSGCSGGQYIDGQSIVVTASPASGWRVKSWTGTNNNSSTSNSNVVSMPNRDHTVTVRYEQLACYPLTLAHEGQGANPAATPTNSSGCANGQYHEGTAISLSAAPAAGWEVIGWKGTIDDGSLDISNFVVMPAGAHKASVRYGLSTVINHRLFLPSVVSIPSVAPSCHQGEKETEPNNSRKQALDNNPSFCLGKTYRGLPTDEWDMFAYSLPTTSRISAVVTNLRRNEGRAALILMTSDGTEKARDENPDDGLSITADSLSPGRYVVVIYLQNPIDGETAEYSLLVETR